MKSSSLLLPVSFARSRRCIATTQSQRSIATLFAHGSRSIQYRRLVNGRFARSASQQLPRPIPASTTSHQFSTPTCTTLRNFTSSSGSVAPRNDALTSSDGVVGYPIDFDSASTIEGKESQVGRMCVYLHHKTDSMLSKSQFYLNSNTMCVH